MKLRLHFEENPIFIVHVAFRFDYGVFLQKEDIYRD